MASIGSRSAGYEMAPVGAASDRAPATAATASTLEQGEADDSANVPSTFRRNQGKR